jgi:hypothetical protein
MPSERSSASAITGEKAARLKVRSDLLEAGLDDGEGDGVDHPCPPGRLIVALALALRGGAEARSDRRVTRSGVMR